MFVLGRIVASFLRIITVLAKRKGLLLSNIAAATTSTGAKAAEDIQDYQSVVEAYNSFDAGKL